MYNTNVLKLLFPGVNIDNLLYQDGSKVEASCESCSHSSNCDNEASDDTTNCNYEIATRDEILRRMTIYIRKNFDNDEVIEEILDILTNVAITRYNISIADLNMARYIYKPCDECDGSGVTISSDIATCGSCCGRGYVVPKLDNKKIVWFAYKDIPYKELGKFFDRREDILKSPLSSYNTSFFYVDGDVKDLNTDTFILFNKKTNKIVSKGTYKEAYDYLSLPWFVDINEVLSDTYDFMLEHKFYEKYGVFSNSRISNMESKLFGYIITEAANNASYAGADELLEKYVAKYNTIDVVKANLLSHISEEETIHLDENLIPVMYKVINDFELIGIELTKLQAANVINDITLLVDKDELPSLSKDVNMVGLYITEVVCISKEYGTLA